MRDAAYDSLLKRRRQELHAKIARVIEQRFPNTKTTEPEVLAHHLTAAGLCEAAIPLWQSAGELALKRMALTEAISHLNRGLELVTTLPWSSQRDAIELERRSRLATAWVALKGWAASEVAISLHPALALTRSQGCRDRMLPILRGLTLNVLAQGRVAESLPRMEETLDLAQLIGDTDQLATGHALACACYCSAGEFIKVLTHADNVRDFYDSKTHYQFAKVFNNDPITIAGIFSSMCTWVLGYPDRALRQNDEKDAHARRHGHPFELGFALSMGAHLFDHRCEGLRARADQYERLRRADNLPEHWAIMAPSLYGVALIREGKPAEAITPLKVRMEAWEASGGKVRIPMMKAFLAEAVALTGDLDNALHLLGEAIEQIERPGWEERLFYAEILRLKGWTLQLKGDPDGAEQNFHTSLDWARRQQAKSWELRTSTSLARLLQSKNKRQDAYELLAPVYNWFTEGFDTKDLLEAKALLAELG